MPSVLKKFAKPGKTGRSNSFRVILQTHRLSKDLKSQVHVAKVLTSVEFGCEDICGFQSLCTVG